MSSVFIVIPILALLMFDLGLELTTRDFGMVFQRPRAVIAGMTGQLVLLPAVVWLLCQWLPVSDTMKVGLMLIACCPGGSSSNVFTGIIGGDVALSVSLTAINSVVTLVTLPLIMGMVVELPVGKLVMQNLVLVLVPVAAGMFLRHFGHDAALKIHSVLRKLAFPLLMLLATIFFIVNRTEIIANFGQVGLIVTLLILLSMSGGWLLGWIAQLTEKVRQTLVIEVGMQNSAQAIALAPLVLGSETFAVPAIIYALMMNVILLTYVALIKRLKA